MVKSNKRKPPSRIRYEENNPTVSGRVSREMYDELVRVKGADGKSFADILKIGLAKAKASVKKAEAIRKEGFDKGYKMGYEDAKTVYMVTYSCPICKGTIEVKSEEEIAAIRTYMQEHGWRHAKCYDA